MSELIEKVVTFLEGTNALKLGQSPWPRVDGNSQVMPVHWDVLFPRVGRRRDEPNDFRQVAGDGLLRGEGFEVDPVLNPNWSGRHDPWQVQVPDELSEAVRDAIDNPNTYRKPEDGLKTDVCAWYQPIHFFGYDWGIYIREDCLKAMAVRIAAYVTHTVGIAPPKHAIAPLTKACLRAAFAVYFLHEQYHHKTECFGIRNHVVLSRKVYVPYFKGVYLKLKGTDDHLEEALANADMWHRLGTRPYHYWLGATVLRATKDFLATTFPHDPPGYRKAVNYLEKSDFNTAENLLQGQIHAASAKPTLAVSRWDIAPRMLQSFLPITSDIYAVLTAGRKSVLGSVVAPAPTASTSELVKLAVAHGWELTKGGKGSHVKLIKPHAPPVIVPGDRREVSIGVTKQVLRTLGGYKLHDLTALLRGS